MYGYAIINNIWCLPISASRLYQNRDFKDRYTQWRLECQPGMFPKTGTILTNLGMGHLYNRDEFLLKVGFSRKIRVCQVFIGTGRWRLVTCLRATHRQVCGESIDRRGIGRWPGLSFHIPQAKVQVRFVRSPLRISG